jgi:DNA invertase Pin-like site-specific DNA recombinase
MRPRELPPTVLSRGAVVYVRQSTGAQVQENLESQRRQYALGELARAYGFQDVRVIDDDLGRSASGTVERPGFRSLVGQVCEGLVGAVFCLEASRLARNGRDWHHLLELCGLVGAYVIDTDGAYDPGAPNDRLLLGLKGTMSEFELTLLRKRLLEAALAKARRGELRVPVPIGYVWSAELGLMMDPDRRVQEAVRVIFRLFDRLGSARQVLLHMRRESLIVPRPMDGRHATPVAWRAPVYRTVIAILQNPFYAGAYAYGKSQTRTTIIAGTVRKAHGRRRPMETWTALVRDHHEAYLSWEQFEQNQQRLARNAFRKPAGTAKAGRGGHALLAGLLRCRRCGRMLHVTYGGGGRGAPQPRYTCRVGHAMHGLERCITAGARRPDAAIAHEILLAVQPVAVDAALVAEREAGQHLDERRRALELECQQAEYDVKLAARRYEAVDPDNRLVAAELEARWNAALTRLQDCQVRLAAGAVARAPSVTGESLLALAGDVEAAWHAPTTAMRTKQRLVRTLIEEIVIDVDDATREVVLVIHWRGGQHSEVRVRKPGPGEHTKRTPTDAGRLIREMATRWSDADIATTLNRLGLSTGQGNSWNPRRVGNYRRKAGILGYESAVKDGRCLTMLEAARTLGVTCHVIRALIRDGILLARQIVFDAPWQILASDLKRPEVQAALRRRRTRRGRPYRNSGDTLTFMIPGTSGEGAQ